VILRPTLYLANLVWPHILREIREQGRLSYPPLSSERRVSWTSTEDQGRLVIAALQQARTGEVINVASPEPVTGPELCEMLSRVFGREVHYAPQSVPEFAETLSHMAQSAEVGRLVSALYEGIDELPDDGFVIDAHGLEKRFNMRLTPTSKWIQESIGTLLNRFGG
jgi:NAD(P)H dehydrogenase (quinone)